MMNHIDVSSVLRQTLACDLYSNLVTRSTGAAVRTQIEHLVSESRERALTVIDFSQVSMIDFSCADEIVAKLLMRYCAAGAPAADEPPPRDAYFLFRGVSDSHLDAIETVLDRHGLAIVAQIEDGSVMLVGTVGDTERRTWEAMCRLGRAAPEELAREAELDARALAEVLDVLCRRRLAMRFEEGYVAVGAAP